ncbi:MAG: DUF1624 domain-containing protein [Ruminiclostridium sp.]|nr:DUF1624 domain-containing protein [Ruminiclostridium sp.]
MGKRVGMVDETRGVAVISMVIYHLYFDLVYFYGVNFGNLIDTIFEWWQPFIAGTFIFVSGISANYSKNNFKRGAICFFFGMIFTFATAIITPEAPIYFGVLHLLGISMMIYGFINGFTSRIPWIVGIILFALLYFLTLNVQNGYMGFNWLFTIDMPDMLYNAKLFFPLGFPSPYFQSLDYFPLLPHFLLFMSGASLGVYFKSGGASKGVYMVRFSGLAFLGRKALLIYLLHQPVLVAVLELIFKCLGRNTMFL